MQEPETSISCGVKHFFGRQGIVIDRSRYTRAMPIVTAVGTEFSVNRGADQVVVAVIEGRVLVGSRMVAPRVDEKRAYRNQATLPPVSKS